MSGSLNTYGEWVPGLVHPDPVTVFGTSGGGGGSTGSGTVDPNTLGLSSSVTSYDLHDATTGAYIATYYRNPVTGVFE